ncbi:MAG: TraB/GumN family protein [Kiloniellales bacterium]|nr:TraB/GumN family protein [Kiloniellales bacterium]
MSVGLSSRRLCLALTILFLSIAPAGAADPLLHGQGIFWRIEGKGAKPSHILGTFHTADQRVLDLTATIGEALRAARSVTLERVMTYDDGLKVQEAMMLDGRRDLEQILGRKLFNEVALAARAYRMRPADLRRLKPWAVYLLLGSPPGEAIRQGMGTPFLDYMLQQAAEQMGKPVYGLERVEDVFGFFDELSRERQVTLVQAALRFNYYVDNHFYKALRFYLRADMAGLMAYFDRQYRLEDQGLAAVLQARFIDERNAVMVRNMQKQLKAGRAFVAVGAAHLPGEKGVLHLLEKRGYTVTRVY